MGRRGTEEKEKDARFTQGRIIILLGVVWVWCVWVEIRKKLGRAVSALTAGHEVSLSILVAAGVRSALTRPRARDSTGAPEIRGPRQLERRVSRTQCECDHGADAPAKASRCLEIYTAQVSRRRAPQQAGGSKRSTQPGSVTRVGSDAARLRPGVHIFLPPKVGSGCRRAAFDRCSPSGRH